MSARAAAVPAGSPAPPEIVSGSAPAPPAATAENPRAEAKAERRGGLGPCARCGARSREGRGLPSRGWGAAGSHANCGGLAPWGERSHPG